MNKLQLNKSQSGLAAVEATLVLPLLLLLMLAIGEFGRLLYQYNTLTRAVRAGAQIEVDANNIFDSSAKASREQRITNLILYGNVTGGSNTLLPGMTSDDIDFNYIQSPAGSGDWYYQVDVSYNWQPMFGASLDTFFGDVLSLSFPLSSSITVRELSQ
ncbi:hypothetical protein OJHNALOF_02923 [Oceanimonas sp. MB9]|nr:hypothetical protein [Oceanimonas sp. MB9]